VSSLILIPVAVATSNFSTQLSEQSALPILLLLFGTLASSAAGRVFYQTALTATQNDNGYVTMFFLLTPVLTPLISVRRRAPFLHRDGAGDDPAFLVFPDNLAGPTDAPSLR
jgi:hypothetical protein